MKSIRRIGVPPATEPTAAPADRPPGHTRFVDAVLVDQAATAEEAFERALRERAAAERAADPTLSAEDARVFATIHLCMGGNSSGGPTKPVRHRPMIDGSRKQ